MNTYLISSFSLRLLHEEINKIITSSDNVIRMNMDEININDVISECSYYSLLKETKYVIINNFKLKKEYNQITKYIAEPNPDTVLILIAESIDKRSIIYKEILKNGTIILIDDLKNINSKIKEYCQNNNIEIDYLAISELLNNNLDNYDLVLNEIDKISLITNKITKEEVLKYSIKLISEDNFSFSDAVLNKNYQEIANHLEDFINLRSEVFPFIGLLANQYRLIYTVKRLDETNEQIGKKLGIHPYRVKLAKEKANFYSKDELQKKLLDLCDLDYNLKNSNIDKYILLKIFLINV
ncbi:MAG: DNA polymerase III subunit delta [Bacilli bacterium]|nr:DNA polymerase III subunit delta [Bacilli bacterium]